MLLPWIGLPLTTVLLLKLLASLASSPRMLTLKRPWLRWSGLCCRT
ncbi:MAG: hypothetical protein OXI08_00630 [Cyanobacteria bacterium MAG IRC4_bin_6]|nr:hypothetical protein [Cyanobacteria bacterium MAG IRC4_bin_6]